MGLNTNINGEPGAANPVRAHLLRAATLSGVLVVLLQMHGLVCSVLACNREYVLLGFGLIVLAAWLYGWKSVLYLLPGITLQAVMQGYGYAELLASADGHALMATICAPFAFNTMRWAGINTEVDLSGGRRVWKIILLAGIKASAFALILRSLLTDLHPTQTLSFDIAYPTVLSNLAGLAIFMLILIGIFRATQPHE